MKAIKDAADKRKGITKTNLNPTNPSNGTNNGTNNATIIIPDNTTPTDDAGDGTLKC
jgi:hypothetical protein